MPVLYNWTLLVIMVIGYQTNPVDNAITLAALAFSVGSKAGLLQKIA
jgi:hypothetical protein